MSAHKGGEGQVPFGGFDYQDQTGQITNGQVTVTDGNGQLHSAPFTVSGGHAHVTPEELGMPMNVTHIEFETTPPMPHTVGGFGADPLQVRPGYVFGGPATAFTVGEGNRILCPEVEAPSQ